MASTGLLFRLQRGNDERHRFVAAWSSCPTNPRFVSIWRSLKRASVAGAKSDGPRGCRTQH
jgi:hypothetical protein